MGLKGLLADLIHFDPSLYQSLLAMLMYDEDDIEEVFMTTFQINCQGKTIDLIQNADENTYVNQLNKHQFVELYVDHIQNKSVRNHVTALQEGFLMIVSDMKLLSVFRPEELDPLIRGSDVSIIYLINTKNKAILYNN